MSWCDVFELVRGVHKTFRGSPQLDFDDLDSDCSLALTGLSRHQLERLCQETNLRHSKHWSPMNSLGVYLMRLRTGLVLFDINVFVLFLVLSGIFSVATVVIIVPFFISFHLISGLSLREIAALFQRTYYSVGQRIQETRRLLASCDFVRRHIGFDHITKDDIIHKHTTDYAREFYGVLESRLVLLSVFVSFMPFQL